MKKKVYGIMIVCAMVVALAFTSARTNEKKVDAEDQALKFDSSTGTTVSVTVDGNTLNVTKYCVTYVAYPIAMATSQPSYGPSGFQGYTTLSDVYCYQKMYIYVPETAANSQTTAIILQVGNGGWRTSAANDIITDGGSFTSTSDTDKTGAALSAGYVIVNAGTRSRGALAEDGTWAGKSPAVVVDAKAAIRYLKLNDKLMPGSADRIVITGGSGGGGLSVVIAASGNSPDYYPYLKEIGAAGIDEQGKSTLTDDVFATIAYCPINDLGNADIAYEWQYAATRLLSDSYTSGGTLSDDMKEASAELAAMYPKYLSGLKLKLNNGKPLNVNTMPDAILALVKAAIEENLANGTTIPNYGDSWTLSGMGSSVTVENDWFKYDSTTNKVTWMDYDNYLACVATITALKTIPAFDATGTLGTTVLSGENSLFGSKDVEYSNFEEWAWNNNAISGDGSGYDDTNLYWAQYLKTSAGSELAKQIKMCSPIPYLTSSKEGDSAPYWYVRHGVRDRDTSFAVQVQLYYAIDNDPSVLDANYKLSYFQPHGGDWDVQEAYSWLAEALKYHPHPEKNKHNRKHKCGI